MTSHWDRQEFCRWTVLPYLLCLRWQYHLRTYWMPLVKKRISHHKAKPDNGLITGTAFLGFTAYLTTLFKTHLAAPCERQHTKLTFLSAQDSACPESIASPASSSSPENGVRGRGLITSFMLHLMATHKTSVFIFPHLGTLLCKWSWLLKK